MWCREAIRQAWIATGAVCICAATCASGVARAEGAAWDTLSQDQQALLQPLADKWAGLPADQQERLANGSQRWVQMNPDERAAAQDRFKTWRGLSPDKRQQ